MITILHLILKSGKELTFVVCHSHMLIMALVVLVITITIHTNEHGVYKLFTWHLYLCCCIMRKKNVFYNWP
jgi:hypothetical protein